MASTSMIRFVDVSYTLPSDRVLFDRVNFEVALGGITLLMGPSGCGKSTLLKLITGQVAPDHGEIWVDDAPLHQLRGEGLYGARRKMGMLFQSGGLFTDLNVFENVAFPAREHLKMPEYMIRDLVLLKLQAVGLRGAIDLMPHELSGGMVRRVALARSIMLDPQILLYDEPLTGQDPITVGVLLRLMQSLNTALGITSLVVSHQLKVIGPIVDQVLMVNEGQVLSCGKPDTLAESPHAKVRQFVTGALDDSFHYPAGDFREALSL